MKLRDKIKSYSFWVSLTSAIILILKILGNRFGFVVDETMISDLFTALCSILVLLGIIVPPQNTSNTSVKQTIEKSTTDNSQIKEQINQLTTNDNKPETESTLDSETNQPKNEIVSNNQDSEEIITNQQEITNVEVLASETNNTLMINQNIENLNTSESVSESNEIDSENFDLKQMLFEIKEKFSGNLDSYIFELQEEIRKTREGM